MKEKGPKQQWPRKIKRFFTSVTTPDPGFMEKTFSLGERAPYNQEAGEKDKHNRRGEENNRRIIKPLPLAKVRRKPLAVRPLEVKKEGGQGEEKNSNAKKTATGTDAQEKRQAQSGQGEGSQQDYQAALKAQAEDVQEEEPFLAWDIDPRLSVNLERVSRVFHIPPNMDVVVREFEIPFEPPLKAAIVYIDGAASRDVADNYILKPLMLLPRLEGEEKEAVRGDPVDLVYKTLLPGNQVARKERFQDLVEAVLNGDTAVLVDGSREVLTVESKAWPVRSVEPPRSEAVIRGPQEAFVEHLRVNTGLVRKHLRNQSLVTEIFTLGQVSRTQVAIMYLQGLVNPKLLAEVKRRLEMVKTDAITDSGILEIFIDDNPRAFVPQILATERPDRAAAFLTEGHVVILVDGSPFALIVPVTFWALLHTPEDYYLRWPFGTFVRWIRFLAFFFALLTPALYIAIVNYHQEMIPTDLLLAIAASRERVPFPAVVEVILMEVSFELIREAGVRIPSVIGPTIGIVGALILGQAAVAANIVSPILVIVVAVTGLASSAIPNYGLNLSLRIYRFAFLVAAALFGFVGIAVLLFLLNVHTVGQKSFGVPVVSPVAPYRPPSFDLVTLREMFKHSLLPRYTRPRRHRRQEEFNRYWHPLTTMLAKTKGEDRKEDDKRQEG